MLAEKPWRAEGLRVSSTDVMESFSLSMKAEEDGW